MADFEAHPPGSRAITIPLHSTKTLNHTNRRRRGVRNLKQIETGDSPDTRSLSLSSDPDSPSSYSQSPAALVSQQQQTSIASPGDKDPRLPLSNAIESKGKGKAKAKEELQTKTPTTPPNYSFFPTNSPLGACMLSSSQYKSVNLNAHHDDPDEPPRLITYTKYSQGFTWNDELFLPSYLLGRSGRRRRRRYGYEDEDDDDDDIFNDEEGEQCPVAEIFVTDEEAHAMIP